MKWTLMLLWIVVSGFGMADAITRTERGALKLLFWATDGRNWARTWDIQNPRGDPCLDNWPGIVCDRFGRIQAIRLPNNNLAGFLPPEFFRVGLDGLQELDLSANYLAGVVPESISNLASLRILRLDRNVLVGSVPASIGQLKSLEFLALGGNQFDPVDTSTGSIVPDAVLQLGRSPGLYRCRISA